MANCSDVPSPCSNSDELPIVIGSLITYAFDKRRFNFTSPQFITSIKEPDEPINDEIVQPKLAKMEDLTAKRLILEYFHNHNLDKLKYDTLMDDGSAKTVVEFISQGISSGKSKPGPSKLNPNYCFRRCIAIIFSKKVQSMPRIVSDKYRQVFKLTQMDHRFLWSGCSFVIAIAVI